MASIDFLLDGFRAFRDEHFERRPERFARLAREGQSPAAAVVACADSRVDPAILFGAGPGDLFVVRNVANLVPPYAVDDRLPGTGAALEFAVRDLGVGHVIVLGHARCGGIGAALASVRGRPPERDLIGHWLALAEAPCRRASTAHDPDSEECRAAAEQLSIAQSLAHLRTFPWIAERERAGGLAIHGWWFDLIAGTLDTIEADSGAPRRLVP